VLNVLDMHGCVPKYICQSVVLKAYTKLDRILLTQDIAPMRASSILRIWLNTHTDTMVPGI